MIEVNTIRALRQFCRASFAVPLGLFTVAPRIIKISVIGYTTTNGFTALTDLSGPVTSADGNCFIKHTQHLMVSYLNQPWPYLATAAFVALMGLYAWKQPHRPGNRYFYWVVGVWIVWALADALATIFPTSEVRYWIWGLQLLSVLYLSPLELLFSLDYTGNEKWINCCRTALLALPALLFGLLVISVPISYLTSIEVRSGAEILVTATPVRWGLFAFNMVIWLAGVGLLFSSLLRAPSFSLPIGLILLGQAVPRIVFVATIPLHTLLTPVRLTVLASNLSVLAIIIAMYNYKLLRVIPVARDRAVFHMPYAILVLDAENSLVDFNPAAQTLPGLPGKLALRQAPDKALGEWWGRISSLVGPEPVSKDLKVQTNSGQRDYHVFGYPFLQPGGWRIGEVFVLEDITQIKQAQRLQAQTMWAKAILQEREQLAHELDEGISQSLAFLNLQAQAAQVQIQTGQNAAAHASLGRLTEAAGHIQAETRELIGNLLSVSLPAEDFCATLRQVLASFELHTGLKTHLEIEQDSASTSQLFDTIHLPPLVAVQLVRITQEALTNVRKHAKGASRVTIQLKPMAEQLSIDILDDGPGFNLDHQQSSRKHFGMEVMRQRAERAGGQITVKSVLGMGTHIKICVPLANGAPRSKE